MSQMIFHKLFIVGKKWNQSLYKETKTVNWPKINQFIDVLKLITLKSQLVKSQMVMEQLSNILNPWILHGLNFNYQMMVNLLTLETVQPKLKFILPQVYWEMLNFINIFKTSQFITWWLDFQDKQFKLFRLMILMSNWVIFILMCMAHMQIHLSRKEISTVFYIQTKSFFSFKALQREVEIFIISLES